MTLIELQAAIKTIVRDAESRIANLAPDSPEALEYLVHAHWPDVDEAVSQVISEAEWICNQAEPKGEQHEK